MAWLHAQAAMALMAKAMPQPVLRDGHDLGWRQPILLRHCPYRHGTHSGAAVSKDGRWLGSQQSIKLMSLLIGYLARCERQIKNAHASPLCRNLDFSKHRLIRAFAIRAVANDGTKAGILQCDDVVGSDLR